MNSRSDPPSKLCVDETAETSGVPLVTLNDGNRIPQLGFGLARVDDRGDALMTITNALEAGYRHFDTAAYYGNEGELGAALRSSGIQREDLFITTKLWNDDHGVAKAQAALRGSLDRLGLDYVDLYLIHWPRPDRDLYLATWRALEAMKADGLARSIGVSNFTRAHLARLLSASNTRPAVDQVELHPLFAQRRLRRLANRCGITIQAWAPLAEGSPDLLSSPTLRSIAQRHGVSPAQVVIRWHLQHGFVLFPKTQRPERMRENLNVFAFELSMADMHQIDGLDLGVRLGPDPDTMTL